MKILYGRGFCKITFEGDEKNSGKTLFVRGEQGDSDEFFVYKSLLDKMSWSFTKDGETCCSWVDNNEKDEILAYVIEEAKKEGCSLVLW